MTKNSRKLLLMLFVILFTTVEYSFGQFNLRPNASTYNTTQTEQIRVTGNDSIVKPSDIAVYSKAYKEYVRREVFKYRNKVNLRSSIGITQTSFNNWAAGGTNSFSGRLWVNFSHIYTNEESNFNVNSVFESAYTMVVADKKASKSEDFLNITSTPSWKLNNQFEFSGSFVFRSQLTDGYTADTIFSSSFFSPAYLTLSAGITYIPFKDNCLKIFVAPISGNGTFILNGDLASKGLYGVPAGQKSLTKFGMFNRVEFKKAIFKNAGLIETKLESFWDYTNCPNLIWETRLSYNISELFGVSLYLKFIYDDTIATPDAAQNNFWQVNQALSFNFMFNRASKPNAGKPTYLTETVIL